ncbi:MAG: 2-aminoethylphosphonate--pyruvate transaminase [Planctomycetaceae bacterium]|nr:2-aminoethylphosphonate--pyruvate transaminase [Planctomycetaceae bacterium]
MRKTTSGWKDKILFTPGPLTTSRTVKQALLRDLGSRDFEFISLIKDIRDGLVKVGQATTDKYTTVIMQGSGTFALEAVVGSTTPPNGKFMVLINGAYGHRIAKMGKVLKIDTIPVEFPENTKVDPVKVAEALKANPGVTNVAVVHCETTTGIINPIKEIGAVVKKAGAKYFVDGMSSFGAVPVSLEECQIDYLVSSANKCIEGVPGFSFAVCRIESLLATKGYARSLSLDLLDQYLGFEKNGQFRFTPPTHAMIAFRQALAELEAEGGVPGRAARYKSNYDTLVAGMRQMGFKEYLPAADQGYIITSFVYPKDPNFNFEAFYEKLNDRDYVIYPGKVSNADCFRIGNIGRIFPSDVQDLLGVIRETIAQMGVKL